MQIVIPSRGRADTISGHTLRLFPDALVCVEDSEAEDYSGVGAELLLHPPLSGYEQIVNWILACEDLLDDCICIIDDDLLGIISTSTKTQITEPQDALAVLDNCREMAEGFGAALWGFPVNSPPWWQPILKPLGLTARIGGCMGISDRSIRMDERITMGSDIDLLLTELLFRRIVLQDKRFVFKFTPIFKSEGGSADHYAAVKKVEQERILKQKWGPYVRFVHKPGHWNETMAAVQR